jgi:hypothetical protein
MPQPRTWQTLYRYAIIWDSKATLYHGPDGTTKTSGGSTQKSSGAGNIVGNKFSVL